MAFVQGEALIHSLIKDRKTEPKPEQIFEKTENPDNQNCQDRANTKCNVSQLFPDRLKIVTKM